jgi:N-acyl-D-amino-acid deacylase
LANRQFRARELGLWRVLQIPGASNVCGRVKVISSLSAVICLLLISGLLAAQDRATLISNVLLVDGSGAAPRQGAVRLAGDKITAVGELSALPDEVVFDGNGLVLAPGFIDTHSHHDHGMDDDSAATEAISQGITTVVVGQDGSSVHPLRDLFAKRAASPASINIASYSGHNTLRALAVHPQNGPASEAQLLTMQQMLQADLDAGALGLSTGLEYDPGIWSDTDEVLALANVAAAAGGRYISHMRSEDVRFWDALRELIFIGRRADIPVQISHMKLASRSLWGSAAKVLQVLDQSRAVGIDVTADIYPYTYWQSTLLVLLPAGFFNDRDAAEFALTELSSAAGMRLTRFDADPALVGMTIADIAESREEEAADTYLWLINTSINAGEGMRRESVMGESMSEDDIGVLMNWAHTNFCSDGALKDGHPRGAGSFPRILSRYVREQGVMPLQTAIHKATALAANHTGIENRGYIREGFYADLVMFDPDTIADRATVENPFATPVGIKAVWVNGELVVHDGVVSDARPGRVIRRANVN